MEVNDLKIIFFGTPEFAVESLEALLDEGFNISAVVTMPDKVGGRGNKIIESAVKQCAVKHNLPLLQPVKLSDPGFVGQLRSYGADLFIVIAFRMLPRVVWTMPPLGTFNLHASLLPKYRGAAPINRAIMNGETETGVTTFLLKHELDTGDILMQRRLEIGPDENVGSLYERLMHTGAELTVQTVRTIADGTARPVPQDSLKDIAPSPAPKIFHDDCRIDWTCGAAQIHNQVRGLSPVPGAWCGFTCGGRQGQPETTIKVLETRLAERMPLEPGQIAVGSKKLFVGTGSGTIELLTVQPAGKRPMSALAWLNGVRPWQDGRIPWLL